VPWRARKQRGVRSMTGDSITTVGAWKPTASSRAASGSSSASTKLRRLLGSQCAYHWSVVVGLLWPSCAAT
jgi:hypothetical protein